MKAENQCVQINTFSQLSFSIFLYRPYDNM